MKHRIFYIFAITLLVLIGCDGGGSGTDEARVRYFHASPNASALDAFVDSLLVGSSITYSTGTGYLGMDEGARNLRVVASGTSTELINTPITLDDDTDYTVVIGNYLAGIEPIVIVDDNGHPDIRNFRIRAINTSPSSGPIDVYILRQDVSLAGQSPTFTNLSYSGVSAYEQIDTNEYVVWITASGTQQVLATTSSTRFDEDEVFSLFIVEAPGGGAPLSVSIVKDRD